MNKTFEISYNRAFLRITEGGAIFITEQLINKANYHLGKNNWYATKFWAREIENKEPFNKGDQNDYTVTLSMEVKERTRIE